MASKDEKEQALAVLTHGDLDFLCQAFDKEPSSGVSFEPVEPVTINYNLTRPSSVPDWTNPIFRRDQSSDEIRVLENASNDFQELSNQVSLPEVIRKTAHGQSSDVISRVLENAKPTRASEK